MKKLFMTGVKMLSFYYLQQKLFQIDRLVDRVKFLESRVEGLNKSNVVLSEDINRLRNRRAKMVL